MKIVWRICQQRYAAHPLDGEGARLAGGRWNGKGTPLIYTSESLSLATLETLVHAQAHLLAAAGLVAIELAIPDEATSATLSDADLPANWRSYPAPAALQKLGTAWAKQSRSLFLSVPSAVIPSERNVLINPVHAEIRSVTIKSVRRFDPDPRLR